MSDSVLKAAISIYADTGSSLSMSDVAEKAGVSRQTVYRKFGSKSHLLAQLSMLEGKSGTVFDIDDRVIQSAYAVFANHGFRAASIEQVAQGAGVSVATIYRRFGDKDGLVKAFISARSPKGNLPVSIFESDGNFEDKIDDLAKFLLRFVFENKPLLRMVYSGSTDDRAYMNAFRNRSNSTFSHLEGFFETHQKAGNIPQKISAADLASHLFGMVYAQAILAPWSEAVDLERGARAIAIMFQSYAKACST